VPATGYWWRGGSPVLVVEKKRFPREDLGDGLTPRAVRNSRTWASAKLSDRWRFDGLRSIAHGVTLELEWPEHPDSPTRLRRPPPTRQMWPTAPLARRRGLDRRGAVAPLVEDGLLVGR